jgi:hypothetical protein
LPRAIRADAGATTPSGTAVRFFTALPNSVYLVGRRNRVRDDMNRHLITLMTHMPTELAMY